MKTILLTLLFLSTLCLAWPAELLFFHTFETGMPDGWTTEGLPSWEISNTENAGAEMPELMLNPLPGTGVRRFISPPINTAEFHELTLMFWHSLEYLEGSGMSFNLNVEVSTDGINWTSLWGLLVSADVGSQYVSVTIPRTYLYTATFYVSFACDGQWGSYSGWYLDNLHLVVNRKIASGTWTEAGSPYFMHCDYIVPFGYEWIIEPGVELFFDNGCGIDVYGSIQAEGTPADSIWFMPSYFMSTWRGITMDNSDDNEIEFSYCVFQGCDKGTQGAGGALYIDILFGEVRINNCRFSENYAGQAGALYIQMAMYAYIEYCHFDHNYSSGTVSTLYVNAYNGIYLMHSAFGNNYFEYGSGFAHVSLVALESFVYSHLYANSFANNETADAALAIMGNTDAGNSFSSLGIMSCIFWDPYCTYEALFFEAFTGGRTATFSYCDISSSKITGTTPVLLNNIDSDPLFISNEDCQLLGTSPCVNTGPVGHLDPDGSRKDMGAYPIYNKAIIQIVKDVPYDQGRKVEVFWKASEMDNTWMPGSFYTVWRGDTFRGTGTVITSPLELNRLSGWNNVWWLDGRDTAWQLVSGQINAYNFSYYAFESPTQQDSSITGNNAVPFKVVYQWVNGFSTSAEMSGYSVDNIPPDPARNLVISREGEQLRLDWSAVTTGTYNGSSYSELGNIHYKIYCSEEPYFEAGPDTYLTTTEQTFNLLSYLTASKKFFKVVTCDQ